MNEILHDIAIEQGWKIRGISKVHGGDVNQAFCIDTWSGKYFVKLNDTRRKPQLFAKEANGLIALRQHFPLKVPEIIAVGKMGEMQYLILEWLQQSHAVANTAEQFGQALAQMHRATNASFGWPEESYIASVPQTNEWYDNWPLFYAEKRIMPLAKRLLDKNIFTNKDVQKTEQLCNRFAELMPEEPPALLHGDLWNGNAMTISENNETTTAIYDPNVYYGHREMDIAMTKLFGGFSASFYTPGLCDL